MKQGELCYDLVPTALGWIGVVASPRGLRRVTVPSATPERALQLLGTEALQARRQAGAFEDLRQRLQRHLQGDKVSLDDPLDLEGAPAFFRAAWVACRTIPRGEVRSYGWLAAAAGRPGAVRAAGQAMARNPIAILIPCHRVVGASGSLVGYGGGVELKAALLKAEGVGS